MTATGVARVGGRDYAAGLLWQPARSWGDAKVSAERRRDVGADLVCIRRSRVGSKRQMQFGVGSRKDGLRSRQVALAAIVADALGAGAAVGAWPVDGGRWVVLAVKDGLVLPDGDELVEGETAALERVKSLLDPDAVTARTLGHAGQCFVPPSWSDMLPTGWKVVTPGRDLVALVPKGGNRRDRLGAISERSSSGRWVTVAFLSGVLAVCGGVLAWAGVFDVPTPVVSTVIKEPSAPPPPPWWDSVLPQELGPACEQGFERVPSLPGFDFSNLGCASSGRVTLTYKRQSYGTLLTLEKVSVDGKVMVTDRDKVMIDRPAATAVKVAARHDEKPWSREALFREIFGVGQYFGARTDFNELVPPAPPPGSEPPPPPPYRTFRVTYVGWTAAPRLILAHLRAPTFVVESIEFAQENGWKIDGRVYAVR